MVVGNLDVMCFAIEPAKTESPLIVDANAVLPCSIAGQFLQAIAWGNSQVFQRIGGIEQRQFTKRGALEFTGEFFDAFAPKETFGVLVRESPYHDVIIAPRVNNVKRYATPPNDTAHLPGSRETLNNENLVIHSHVMPRLGFASHPTLRFIFTPDGVRRPQHHDGSKPNTLNILRPPRFCKFSRKAVPSHLCFLS